MKREELEAIKARCEVATEGPWACVKYSDDSAMFEPGVSEFYVGFKRNESDTYWEMDSSWITRKGDAEFIAASRQDMPALVAEVERLLNLLERAYTIGDKAADWVTRIKLPEFNALLDEIRKAAGLPKSQRQAKYEALQPKD